MKRALFTVCVVLLALSACVPVSLTPAAQGVPAVTSPTAPPAAATAPTTASTAALTEEQLKNAEYESQFTASGKARLVDGKYEEPAASGSASKVTVTMIPQYATGDLNGDGAADAVVILATNTGGSGTFYTLEAVLNRGGQPVHAATAPLGDRPQVKAVSIDGGVITLDMVVHGPNDPMCCPTQPATLTYQLENGQLVQTGGPTPVP